VHACIGITIAPAGLAMKCTDVLQHACWCWLQVESKAIPEIARELAHLQQLAAAGRLSTEDVSHGSLTISNIGARA
jgi:hypothetical protein